MPISDLLKFHDADLYLAINPPADPLIGVREKFAKAVEATIGQIEKGSTKVPNRMWTVYDFDDGSKAIKFKPKFQKTAIKLDGTESLIIPEKRYAEFVAAFAAAIRAKEFDDQLNLINASDDVGTALAALTDKKSARKRAPSSHEGQINGAIALYLKAKVKPTKEQVADKLRKKNPAFTEAEIAAGIERKYK